MERTVKPASRRKTEGTKFDFRLQFQASRVPVSGWDKLVVSLLSIETGRITAKTYKGIVRNGSCQWPDPVVEFTKLFQNASTGECNDKLYKLFVQMGSLRVGILGEATINLADYVTAESPETVSLPLRNCSAGTVLHVKIQCLTPKSGLRELEGQRSGSLDQDCRASVSEDNSSNSDISENLTSCSVGASANQNLAALSYLPTLQGQYRQGGDSSSVLQRDGSPSVVASHHRSDVGYHSYDDSASNGMVKDFPSADVSLFGLEHHFSRRPNSATSRDSCNSRESSKASHTKYQTGFSNLPNLQNLQTELANTNLGLPAKENGAWIAAGLPQKLEAAEATIQDLQDETLVWERRARKLSVEVETFRQQLAFELKNVSELRVEMLATEAERDSLKSQVEQLKVVKVVPRMWGGMDNYSRWEMEDSRKMIKGLQEEVIYEKEVNANLQVQLCKMQDSNVDLLTALTELEETLVASNKVVDKVTEANKKLEEELFQARCTEPQTTSKPAEDCELKLWQQEEVEWHQRLRASEAILAEKEQKIKCMESQVGAVELKSAQQLKEKDEHIKELMSRLEVSECRTITSWSVLDKEFKDENMERIFKFIRANRDPDSKVEPFTKLEGRAEQHLVSEAGYLQTPSGNQPTETQGSTAVFQLQIEELEGKTKRLENLVQALEREKGESLEKIDKQDVQLRTFVAEITNLHEDSKTHLDTRTKLEERIAEIGAEVDKLALDVADREASMKNLELLLLEASTEQSRQTQRFEEVLEEMETLNMALDSLSSAKKTLEDETSELLVIKQELEARISDLEELNKGLSERVSSLETQLTNMFKDQEQLSILQSHRTLLEQELNLATSECRTAQDKFAALEVKMMRQQQESDNEEKILRIEIESLLVCKKSLEQRANEAEEALIAEQEEKAASVNLSQTKLEQLSSVVNEKENLALQATAKVAELHAEKLALESSLGLMNEKVKDLEELSLLQKDLGIKAEEVSLELDASKILCNDLTQQLLEKESVVQQQLLIKEKQEKDFQRRVGLLEEELLLNADVFSRIEKRFMLSQGDYRSKKSVNSIESKDFLELQERLQCLEDEANANKEQLIICRREFMQKETELMGKIECLELSNEQLAAGLIDSGAEQLKHELIRLQNQNSFLSRKEQELRSRMHTQEVLQEEVKRLEEANDLLEARLSKFVETAKNPFLLEKIVSLETELAEAVEANNMYKLQLKSVFEKQQNVSMAALQEFGDFNQVIEDLFQYKKKATQLQGELDYMHERYTLISLQLAEAEAERGELMITVKNLKGARKL
eukprot:c16957_g1_i3 orf=172-4059(+)